MPDVASIIDRPIKTRAPPRRNTTRTTRTRPLGQIGAPAVVGSPPQPTEQATDQPVPEEGDNNSVNRHGTAEGNAPEAADVVLGQQGTEVLHQTSRRSARSRLASSANAQLQASTNTAAAAETTSGSSLRVKRGGQASNKIPTSTSQSGSKRKRADATIPKGATSSASTERNPSNEELLRHATSQLVSVSDLAAVIDGTSRPSRTTRTKQAPAQDAVEEAGGMADESTGETGGDTTTRPTIRKRQKKSMGDVAAEIVAEASGGKHARRRRKATPEDAEDHVIEPSAVTMGELCEASNLGKKSTTERAMQDVDWDAVKKQWKEDADKAYQLKLAGKKPEKRQATGAEAATAEPITQLVPSTMVVNGEIVFADETRHIDRQQDIENIASNESRTIVTEDRITKRVNSSTVGAPRGLQNAKKQWDEVSTEKFYRGLRMFGTDFMMISHMFPHLTRRHIKLKFVKEERTNLVKIQENLAEANREPVDLKAFEEETEKVFEDPRKVEEEIKAEEMRLRAEDEKRRELEKAGRHPEEGDEEPRAADEDGNIVETIEGDDTNASGNRFAAVAEGIVNQAVAPKKKQQRKAAGPKKKAASKKLYKAMEGTVEVLGTVQDVPR